MSGKDRVAHDGRDSVPVRNDGNRWANGEYPERYVEDVKASIGFAGLDMDMFTRGKAEDVVQLLAQLSKAPIGELNCLDIGCGVGVMHPFLADQMGSLSGCDVSGQVKSAWPPNSLRRSESLP